MNLSTNPRILKEIRLAASLNYSICFVGFHLGNWSDELEKKILEGLPSITSHYMDATRKHFLRWLGHSLTERINRIVWKLKINNLYLAASGSTKRTLALLNYAKSIKPGDFDFVIGHTLGSFYPA